jgi:hypothetical protein
VGGVVVGGVAELKPTTVFLCMRLAAKVARRLDSPEIELRASRLSSIVVMGILESKQLGNLNSGIAKR